MSLISKYLVKDETQCDFDKNKKTVLYLDLNNLFHRCYNVAESTNGNTLDILLNSAYFIKVGIQHNFAFAILDGENNKKTRLEIYPEYKANRTPKSEEEQQKINFLLQESKRLMKILGFNFYESNEIEADDVIGILSRKSATNGWNVICVSSDKDYKQLCDIPHLNIYDGMKKTIINRNNIGELNAKQFVDYLALVGDKSDNIIGVSKVGDKTATNWLQRFGSLDNILVSLVRDGSITKEELFTPEYISSINDGTLMQVDFDCNKPKEVAEDSIKSGVTKNNLIEAFKSGRLIMNKKLVQFQYDKADKVNIPREEIKPLKINIKELDAFCLKHKLFSFREKMILPMQNNPEPTAQQTSKMKI